MRLRGEVRHRLTLSVAAVGCLAASLVSVAGTPAYAAEKGWTCASFATKDDAESAEPPATTKMPADPFEEMQISPAKQALKKNHHGLGTGVTVAVIDSGIAGVAEQDFAGKVTGEPFYHATTVAGLITGIAPGVKLLNLPVYGTSKDDSSEEPKVSVPAVSAALDHLLRGQHLDRLIVNMSLDLDLSAGSDARIRQQVEKLIDRGAVVVAATGNPGGDGPRASPGPGADFADQIKPAAYPGVVAVGVSLSKGAPGDLSQYALPNSRTTVVAPTYGARSRTLGGHDCWVDQTATSWSTAEVSGVLALIASAYPEASNTELVDRLVRTASGRPDEAGRFTGAGVVQAYAAVTRPLGPEGATGGSVKRADVAPPAADVLAGTRHDAMWWGLLGGGALILGLVLRPLLTRRK